MEKLENRESLYSIKGNTPSLLKGMLRDRRIILATLIEQNDQKANMLLTLAVSFLFVVTFVLLRFVTYIHFPYWILFIPFLGLFLCISLILLSTKPTIDTFDKIINNEIVPNYLERKFYTLALGSKMSLEEKEEHTSEVAHSHQLQLGNIARSQYLSLKYLEMKFKLLDWAFVSFLSTIFLMALLFLFNLLSSGGTFHRHDERQSHVKYDFIKPTKKFTLNRKLEEISGLTYSASEDVILCHEDEHGKIYSIDPSSGKIVSEKKFGKKDDYEGIEIVGDHIYITTNSGMLHEYNIKTEEVEILKTNFKKKNNIEGLALNAVGDKLLFACKDKPYHPVNGDKGIYSFNLKSKKIDLSPYLAIKRKDLINLAKHIFENKNVINDLSHRLKSFAPSAIGIHPITSDIYIASSKGSMLVVYDRSKVLVDVIALNNILLPQPEGLCFDNQGNLYLSTEGRGGRAKLVMYEYQSSPKKSPES